MKKKIFFLVLLAALFCVSSFVFVVYFFSTIDTIASAYVKIGISAHFVWGSIKLIAFDSIFALIAVISLLAFIHILKSKAFKYEVKYTYEEYKAKRDAEKAKQAADQADREAAAKEARRAELERELAELKKTE